MIDEAIVTLTRIRQGETVSGGDYMRAMKLGIEALELVKEIQVRDRPSLQPTFIRYRLPSEKEKMG